MECCILKLTVKFQSTPDLINRENGAEIINGLWQGLFQSTPDLINRENFCVQH